MPTILTVVLAGLCSAITMAALSVVALDQAPPRADGLGMMTSATVGPVATDAITFTDATGNRYRMRLD